MHRQQSNRNHRSRGGIRLKNVFQVCLLLAICIWLLYQMKHSHDKKKELEQRYSNDSYEVKESQTTVGRFGRKDLPETILKDLKSETGIEEEEKDEVEEESPGEQKVSADHATNGVGLEEEIEQKEQTVVDSEVGKLHVEEHEHEDASSHEAREKSFKGDDASSEVLHLAQVVPEHEEGRESDEGKVEKKERSIDEHNAGEGEHGDGSHEAREISFKGDDVSSAVDHKPVKDSESGEKDFVEKISEDVEKEEKEMEVSHEETTEDSDGNRKDTDMNVQLDSAVENNSSFNHVNPETQLKDDTEASPDKKELVEVVKNPSFSDTKAESGNQNTEQTDQKSTNAIDNQKEVQIVANNPLDNQTLANTSLGDLSKNLESVETNITAGSVEKLETQSSEKQVADPTTNLITEQNQTAPRDPPQEQHDEIKNEVPQNEKSGIEQVTTEQKPSSETVIPKANPEDVHSAASSLTTNVETTKVAPVDSSSSNNSIRNDSAGDGTHSQNGSSSSSGIVNEVQSGIEGAAQ